MIHSGRERARLAGTGPAARRPARFFIPQRQQLFRSIPPSHRRDADGRDHDGRVPHQLSNLNFLWPPPKM